MMWKTKLFSNMRKYINVLILLLAVSGAAVITTVSVMNFLKQSGYTFSGLDGFFYIPGVKTLRNLLLPLILLYSSLYRTRYEFRSYRITQRDGRIQLWNRIFIEVYAGCFIASVFVMVTSGAVAWLATGVLKNFADIESLYYNESAMVFSNGIMTENFPVMTLAALMLNSGELFMHVAVCLLIYWGSDSQIVSFICVFLANLLPDRMDFFDRNGMDIFCYRELCNTGNIIQSSMFIVIGIVIVYILAYMYVPRKNFYK